ncbi:MAG: PSD1 and planctomycete cytochrome C domain-containing protein [Planctomycetia bacterium]|nr:PSD1 and planctomycete cytochrome C domain-containing protein [Planctomycetia bacterium]
MVRKPPLQQLRAMLACAALSVCAAADGASPNANPAVANVARPDFTRDLQPLLARHCGECHGEKKKEGGLDLTHAASLLQGGQSGAAIVKSNADKSLLIERIDDGSMPPEGRPRLSKAEVAVVRDWINTAAKLEAGDGLPPLAPADADYWAFRKPQRPAVPLVANAGRVRSPLDAFVLAQLEAQQLGFSPDADPIALLRRVTFDLTGLPPTPEEVEAFAASYRRPTTQDPYEAVVDRLLASPHYGERWGRHWLDAAGYADTVKTDNDITGTTIREGIWRYRDYVVRSLNDDKPYDRFVREQLAGDEMLGIAELAKLPAESITPEMRELLVATGLLRISVDGTNNFERNRPQERNELLFDTIENVTSNLFGLTVACARCHDHKFDPISQRDYYGLVACLTPSYNLDRWLQPQNRHIIMSTAAEIAEMTAFNKELNTRAGELGGRAARLRKPYEPQDYEARLAALPEAIREDVRAAIAAQQDKRTDVQKYLFEKFDAQLKVTREDTLAAATPADRSEIERLDAEVEDVRARQRTPQKIQALFNVGDVPETRLLRRGNFLTPGPIVGPAIPRVLSDDGDGELFTIDECHQPTSGRRLAAAEALTAPQSRASGLLARVAVNRLWHYHFGRGIVATPGNLGRSGSPPSHPELLEWLAADFIAGGWKLKRVHKEIVMSSVYRQASAGRDVPSAALAADPDNRLLWHAPLRRLESEAVRDAVLAVAGSLDRTLGGPPVLLEGRLDGTVVVSKRALASPTSPWRRSIYLLARRNFGLSLLSVFDQPLMGTNCTQRNQSTVVSQSLTMLHDAFILEQADLLAERVRRTAGDARPAQIRAAYLFVLSRLPSSEESTACEAFLTKQAVHRGEAATVKTTNSTDLALADLCHLLLNTNEFLYVE